MAFFDAQAYSQIFYKVEIHLATTSKILLSLILCEILL